jgi:hypothetical protein
VENHPEIQVDGASWQSVEPVQCRSGVDGFAACVSNGLGVRVARQQPAPAYSTASAREDSDAGLGHRVLRTSIGAKGKRIADDFPELGRSPRPSSEGSHAPRGGGRAAASEREPDPRENTVRGVVSAELPQVLERGRPSLAEEDDAGADQRAVPVDLVAVDDEGGAGSSVQAAPNRVVVDVVVVLPGGAQVRDERPDLRLESPRDANTELRDERVRGAVSSRST